MKNMFIQAKLIRRLTFNHGFKLTGFRTTRPRLSIFLATFFLSFSCSLGEVKIPRARTGSFVHLSPKGLLTFCLNDPSQIVLVFPTLSLSRDMFRAEVFQLRLVIESIFFRYKDVSLANWLILSFVLKIVMPSMFLSSLTLAARISAPNINK